MAGLAINFIEGGFGVIEKLIQLHKLNEWFKLIFGFAITAFTTFCAASGGCLVVGKSWAYSFGWGLLSCSGSVTALFMYNPRTRGIMIVQDKNNMPDLSNYQSVEKGK